MPSATNAALAMCSWTIRQHQHYCSFPPKSQSGGLPPDQHNPQCTTTPNALRQSEAHPQNGRLPCNLPCNCVQLYCMLTGAFCSSTAQLNPDAAEFPQRALYMSMPDMRLHRSVGSIWHAAANAVAACTAVPATEATGRQAACLRQWPRKLFGDQTISHGPWERWLTHGCRCLRPVSMLSGKKTGRRAPVQVGTGAMSKRSLLADPPSTWGRMSRPLFVHWVQSLSPPCPRAGTSTSTAQAQAGDWCHSYCSSLAFSTHQWNLECHGSWQDRSRYKKKCAWSSVNLTLFTPLPTAWASPIQLSNSAVWDLEWQSVQPTSCSSICATFSLLVSQWHTPRVEIQIIDDKATPGYFSIGAIS